MFNDHVVSCLGRLMGAPIPKQELISVPQELIDKHSDPEEEMGHLRAGIAHGSRLLPELGDASRNVEHSSSRENKSRFAHLAILYAWTGHNDCQFLYEEKPPFRVYSVDYGNFFIGGPHWTIFDLEKDKIPFAPPDLISRSGLDKRDLRSACDKLQQINEQNIAEILAVPPNEWGVSFDERIFLGKYLRRRQLQLLTVFSCVPEEGFSSRAYSSGFIAAE